MNKPGFDRANKNFIKLLLIGDSGVGKSALGTYFQNEFFTPIDKPTVCVDFAYKQIKMGNQQVIVEVCDLAGSEQYRSATKTFYKNADCCCLVYDITCQQSFESLKRWKEEFLAIC